MDWILTVSMWVGLTLLLVGVAQLAAWVLVDRLAPPEGQNRWQPTVDWRTRRLLAWVGPYGRESHRTVFSRRRSPHRDDAASLRWHLTQWNPMLPWVTPR